MMKTINTLRFDGGVFTTALAVVVASFLLIGCGDSSTDSDTEEVNIQTTSTQHGDVLADEEGNVLYFFTADVNGESNCEGECLESWPAFSVSEINPEEELDANDFDTIDRPDGGTQTTYKGWPLYYFTGDQEAGDAAGDGVNNEWFVAKPNNSLMIASQQLTGADGEDYIIDENGNYVPGEGMTTHFTDDEGRALYIFTNDSTNTNNCMDQCATTWPVFHTDIEELPSGIDRDHIGEFTAHGDRQQLTFKGWPLYYFADDDRGETQGVSVPEPGVWPVAQNDIEAAPGYDASDEDDDNDDSDDIGY